MCIFWLWMRESWWVISTSRVATADPTSLTNVSEAVKLRKKRQAWWRDPIRLGILAVAALLLYAVWWLATSPTGSTTPSNHENKKRETKPGKRKPKSAHVPSTDISSHA